MTSDNNSEKEIVFNKDMMTDENFKRVIKELIRDLQTNKEIPLDMFCEQLKLKYQITDYPEIDLSQNMWIQCTKNIPNFQSHLQGHRLVSKPEGKIRVPIYGYTVDAELGDFVVKKIVENYNKSKLKKQ